MYLCKSLWISWIVFSAWHPISHASPIEEITANPLQDLEKANLNLVLFRIHGNTNAVVHWTGNLVHTTEWERPTPGLNIVTFWQKWGMWDVIETLENTKIHQKAHEINRLIDGNVYKFNLVPFPISEHDASKSGNVDVIGYIVNITDLANQSYNLDREFTKFKLNLVGILNHTVRHPLYNLNHDLQSIRDDLPLLMKTRRTPLEKENGTILDFESIYKLVEQALSQIEQHVGSVLRTHRIVETFLALQEKQLSLVSKTFDIVDLVKYVYDQHHALAKTKGIHYEIVIEPADTNISPVFKHDSDKLSFCLSALLENAIKFAPINGIVTLYVTVAQTNLSFLVVDNGPGIPVDRTSMILQRIKQGDDFCIDNPDTGSLGLSLMVVNRLVENLMGGKFSIHNHHSPSDSSGGESASSITAQGAFCYFEDLKQQVKHIPKINDVHGFSAHISLPIQRDVIKSYRSSDVSVVVEDRRGSNVAFTNTSNVGVQKQTQLNQASLQERNAFLIIDDDPQVLKLMKRMLSRQGHLLVYTADNGLSGAIEYQRHYKEIRLVITDVQMPEASGYDLARKIRAYESSLRLTQVPILAISGGGSGDIRKRCIDAGCSEYFLKPLNLKQLQDMIQRYAL